MESIPPKIRKKTRVSTFTTIIQHHSESPRYSNQRRKRNKGIQIRKEVKLSLFADDMILYIENPKDSIRKLLLVNLAKLQDIKSIHRNHLYFYILTMKNQKEIKRSIPFTTATKRIKYVIINLAKETKELYTENYDTNERNQR